MKILFSSGANINGGPVKKKVNIKQLPNSTIFWGKCANIYGWESESHKIGNLIQDKKKLCFLSRR